MGYYFLSQPWYTRLAAYVALILSMLLLGGIIRSAWAHDSWINNQGFRNAAGEWCCGKNDCSEVSPRVTGTGYAIRFERHWQTSMMTLDVWAEEIVPFSQAQPSMDGNSYRCQRPDGSRRCFFTPMPSN